MKKYNIVAIIGCIINIIAFLTPAAVSSEDGEIYWIWGFKMKKSITMIKNIPAFNLSIILSVVVLLCIIISIVMVIKYRKVKHDEFGWVWVISGTIIVIITIIWSIAINYLLSTQIKTKDEFGFTNTDYIYFWETHFVGFGIIGLIIGGILLVIAGFVVSSSVDTPIVRPQIVIKSEAQQIKRSAKKYCLFCGAEVNLGSNFCNGCGNKIE